MAIEGIKYYEDNRNITTILHMVKAFASKIVKEGD
jgi:hypothetical protein